MRPLLIVGCLLLPMPGWAVAAPAHCPQLVDPAGDQNPAEDAAADLLGVTIGSDGSSVTVVLRYGGEQPAPTPLTGHEYSVDLNTGEAGLTADALTSPTGTDFAVYRHAVSEGTSGSSASGGTGIGRPAGRLDTTAHTVTMTIPFAMAADILRARQQLEISARTAVSVMTPPVAGYRLFTGNGSDQSDRPVRYRVGVRSCAVRAA
ncbi:MAG: hypothetical protein QOJ79_3019 [Actinomycetota bacterium]|jgi:hypothetical protein|nr:hypothetical protein [Actinomycetota bacterium]